MNKMRVMSISLDEETINLIKKTSEKTDVPMSRLIRRAVWEIYGENNETIL